MTDKETALLFVKAINDHDVDKIYDLMPEDHVFIDGSGEIHSGKTNMREGWQNYYRMFPDYNVEITDVVEGNLVIGLFGYASGTYNIKGDNTNNNFWKTPAAWKTIVENKRIKLWQVYCDYTRLIEIIKKTETD